MSIYYTVITRNIKTVLCEYTDYTGNFQQISINILNQLSQLERIKEGKQMIEYDQYKFFLLCDNVFSFMCLVNSER